MVIIKLHKNTSGYGIYKEKPFYIEKEGIEIKYFKTEKQLISYYNRFLRKKGKHNLKAPIF